MATTNSGKEPLLTQLDGEPETLCGEANRLYQQSSGSGGTVEVKKEKASPRQQKRRPRKQVLNKVAEDMEQPFLGDDSDPEVPLSGSLPWFQSSESILSSGDDGSFIRKDRFVEQVLFH